MTFLERLAIMRKAWERLEAARKRPDVTDDGEFFQASLAHTTWTSTGDMRGLYDRAELGETVLRLLEDSTGGLRDDSDLRVLWHKAVSLGLN